jgi:hypothetical protein
VRYTIVNLYQSTCTNNLNHESTCTSTCTINKCINHAPTCTNQLVINLYHKQVHQTCTNLYVNLYHEQVHQPCTKTIQITCHNNLSKQPITSIVSSILSTKSDLLTNINQQEKSQRYVSTKYNTTTHKHHQDQYVLLIIQVCSYIIHKPCVY